MKVFRSAEEISEHIEPSGFTILDIEYFIRAFIEQNENGPTITEIGTAIGLIQNRSTPLSKSAVFNHLDQLKENGVIELPGQDGNRVPGRIILLK